MSEPTKRVRIRVTPDLRREYVREGAKGILEIGVKETAKQGKANGRVRELVAKHFNVPLKNTIIISGSQSRSKMILIHAQ